MLAAEMTVVSDTRRLFEVRDPDDAATVLREHLGELLADVAATLSLAARRSPAAHREYVCQYRRMSQWLSERSVEFELVPLLLRQLDGEHRLHALRELLAQGAPVAPFSIWAAHYGAGLGVALHALDDLRELDGLPSLSPPPSRPEALNTAPGRGADRPDATFADVGADWLTTFFEGVRWELARSAERPLRRVKRAFGLNDAELGRLFGVTRQAAQQWQARGEVPADRQAKLAALCELAEALEAQLQPGLLPGVARRAADAYDGRTMLDVIAAGEHEWLMEDTRRVFDWSIAA